MIDTGTLRPSLPKFTSEIIDREEVRRMIDARDQIISVQAECVAKQREEIDRLSRRVSELFTLLQEARDYGRKQ